MNRRPGLLDADRLVAAVIFLITFIAYFASAARTVAFWDAGEFITTAYRLGIPHQPGYPLYVLVGRVFSMLRLGMTVAHTINLMSALFGALAVVVMYLTAVHLQRGWSEERQSPSPSWIPRVGAAVGALFLAFSSTYWENSTEAEVYSLSAFAMASASYLALLWYERRQQRNAATLMLLVVYVMGLSIGFHMGSLLVFPGILLIVTLTRDKQFATRDLWIVFLGMTAFVLSTMIDATAPVVVLALAALALALYRRARGHSFALVGLLLFALGLTTYLYLLIRSTQNPAINESNPQTFDALMSVLRRDQYPPRSMLHRSAPLSWQLGHFWGSATWQGGTLQGSQVIGYLQQFTFMFHHSFLDVALPLLLWLYGMLQQLRGDKRTFAGFFTIVLTNTMGLLLFLNFTSSEVRDRDYFYSAGYQYLALFIGLGAGALIRNAWQLAQSRAWMRPVTWATAGALLLAASLPVVGAPLHHPKWFEHDRRRDVAARNYAYNILVGLPPGAVLFTGGDNDTFPLWYLQEVEGFRKDVRVVNLSLINLPWYITQLKEEDPKVPITWTQDQIDGKAPVIYRDPKRELRTKVVAQRLQDGSVLWVRDLALWHIAQANAAGPNKGLYFAVTTEEDFMEGFLPYLVMEGMVYRLDTVSPPSKDGRPRVDSDKVWTNMSKVYDLGGVLNAEGVMDSTIYRDSNAAYLLRNYPAGLSQAAYFYALDDKYEQARAALEMAYRFEPTFPAVRELLPLVYLHLGDVDRLIQLGQVYLRELPDPWRVALDIGNGLISIDQADAALRWAQIVSQRYPNARGTTQLLFASYRAKGDLAGAERVLADYVAHSGDAGAAAELDSFRRAVREGKLRGGVGESAPAGSAPAGSTPTGAAPAGSAPAGSTPTGAAPTGASPTGGQSSAAEPDSGR